jgi:hypothetical protein
MAWAPEAVEVPDPDIKLMLASFDARPGDSTAEELVVEEKGRRYNGQNDFGE